MAIFSHKTATDSGEDSDEARASGVKTGSAYRKQDKESDSVICQTAIGRAIVKGKIGQASV